MPKEIALTNEESEVVTGYISTAGKAITPDHINELASALIKCTPDICNKAMNYILNDAKLRREIAAEIEKTSFAAVQTTDASTKQVLDNYKANSDMYRNMIKTSADNLQLFQTCINELRRIEQEMKEVNSTAQTQVKHIVDQEAQILSQTQGKNNSKWKTAVGVAAGVAVGLGAGIGLGYAVGQNNSPVQSNTQTKIIPNQITGKIK